MPHSERKSQIDDIYRKISQVNEAAAQAASLAKERIKLLEELNDVQPPISVLPPELLCRIFILARPSRLDTCYGPEHAQLFCDLKFVSKHWREILLSNPIIWTEIDLVVFRSNPRRGANPLLPFITHSRQLPLSLGIEFEIFFRDDAKTLIHPSIDPVLLGTLGRVSRLHLKRPPRAWFSHLPLLRQTTHLVLSSLGEAPPLSLDQVVSLSELTVEHVIRIQITSALITTLNLVQMRIDISYHIFINCPNLKYLYLSCYSSNGRHGFPVDSFTLPHLEVLRWEIRIDDNDAWYLAVLNHIYLPSLRTLEWDERRVPYHHDRRAVAGFFVRLPITLTSLKLHNLWEDLGAHEFVAGDVLQIPPYNCQLESITFIDCSVPYCFFFLQNFRPPDQFPRLHTIKKAGRFLVPYPPTRQYIYEVEKRISETCLTILRSRMNMPNRRFTVQVDEMDVRWLNKVEKGLLEFEQSGHQVEILKSRCCLVVNT